MYSVLRDVAEKAGPLTAADEPGQPFLDALHDDINTPVALAELNRIARQLARSEEVSEMRLLAAELLADGALIGLLQEDPAAWFEQGESELDDADIDALIAERQAARDKRDFARSDEIRDQLASLGIVLEDVAGGTRWRRER